MGSNVSRGAWGTRQLIHFFTVVLGVLFFWLLGFLVEDIESIQGPDYATIEHKYVDPSLVTSSERVGKQIADLQRAVNNKREQQRLVGDSSQNLQRTMDQLLELQRLSIQKAASLSEAEKGNLAASLKSFLESQKSYQELNQDIADLTSKKLALEEEKNQLEQQLAAQRRPAQAEFDQLAERHRLRLGVLPVRAARPAPARGRIPADGAAAQPLLPLVPGGWRGHLGKSRAGDPRVFPHAVFQVRADCCPAGRRRPADHLSDPDRGLPQDRRADAAVSRGL